MPKRMTAKRIAAKQNEVDRQNNRADAETEVMIEPERFPNVVSENQNENECEIQKIAMHVLHDQRKRTLAEISFARLTNRACGRIRPERFVIRAAIVVTGQSKSAGRPQDQKRRRKN